MGKIIVKDVDDTSTIDIIVRDGKRIIDRFHNDSKTTPMYYKPSGGILQWLRNKLCDFIWSGDHEFYFLETKENFNLYRCHICKTLKYQSTHIPKSNPNTIIIDGEELTFGQAHDKMMNERARDYMILGLDESTPKELL